MKKQLFTIFCVFIERFQLVCSEGMGGETWTHHFFIMNGPNVQIYAIPGNSNNGTSHSRILILPLVLHFNTYQFPTDIIQNMLDVDAAGISGTIEQRWKCVPSVGGPVLLTM